MVRSNVCLLHKRGRETVMYYAWVNYLDGETRHMRKKIKSVKFSIAQKVSTSIRNIAQKASTSIRNSGSNK